MALTPNKIPNYAVFLFDQRKTSKCMDQIRELINVCKEIGKRSTSSQFRTDLSERNRSISCMLYIYISCY